MSDAKMFSEPTPERGGVPVMAWGVAGVVMLLVAAVVLLTSHRKPVPPAGTLLPLDPYAASLAVSNLAMSESTSLSGGKTTFIDGHIKNNGNKILTGAIVQVLFKNDVQMPPQIETVPVSLIRTHEPYVDTQTLSATPLQPGEEREFRMAFEGITSNWNQQYPEIHVTEVSLR